MTMALSSVLLSAPGPGLYRDVPAETYHRWNAANNSWLNVLHDESPADLHEQIVNPPAPTKDKTLGSAIHAAILQPELFEKTYAMAGGCAGTTAKGSACTFAGSIFRDGKWYCKTHDPLKGVAVNSDRIILSEEDYGMCMRAKEGCEKHPLVHSLLSDPSNIIEVTIVVLDKNGILRRSRLDILQPSRRLVVDLKTTDDVSKAAFSRSIDSFGYYRQGPFYLDNLALLPSDALGGVAYEEFVMIAIPKKKSGPIIPRVFRLTDSDKEKGHDELHGLLAEWQRCRTTGLWPGHGWQWNAKGTDGEYVVEDIELSEWAYRRAA
jgi:hypothetical protein